MLEDKNFCMSSFLMYRMIADPNRCFRSDMVPFFPNMDFQRKGISDSSELCEELRCQVEDASRDGKAALALSGGIDAAILAKFMPKGSVAYTFKCVVPGIEVTDETQAAKKYADECGLEHRVVEIYWEDMEKYAPVLMRHKGAPIHSIEVQIYKAALQAKEDGFERLIFGEAADCIFGGQDNILSKDWLIGDFIERYSYVMPYKVLLDPEVVLEPFLRHCKDGHVDPYEFMSTEYFLESSGAYVNASKTAECGVVLPYTRCFLDAPIDYSRIRNGENKYLVQELFHSLYKDFEVPEKLPMPRPTGEWLKNWYGPTRPEFYPHCTDEMSGDQKWLVWSLEKFLNMLDEE